MKLINPRCTCAARVMVVGSMSVCVSVKSHLTCLFFLKTLSCTYIAGNECKNICGDLPEVTVFKTKINQKSQYYANYTGLLVVNFLHLSPVYTQRRTRSFPAIVNDIQLCPKRCLLMQLAHAGARTDTTPTQHKG